MTGVPHPDGGAPPCEECGAAITGGALECPKCDYIQQGGAPPEPTEVWRELERIWCEALIPEGPDVIQRVTSRVIALRAASRPGPHE
jgi:hypothetical protein